MRKKTIYNNANKLGKSYKLIIGCLTASCLAMPLAPAAFAEGAGAVSVKLGYFNLGMVKANFPLAATQEAIKSQAEAQIRQELQNSNKRIQQLREEKKSEQEISKEIEKAQTAISAKTEALAQLVQTQAGMVNGQILRATAAVAKEKGLDVIVDGQAIFSGGQTFLDKGVDVTKDVIAKLSAGSRAGE